MNKTLQERKVAETFAELGSRDGGGETELTIEELSRAVGENALLQTEVSRQMALRLVELRNEIDAAKTEIEQLQRQTEDLVRGVSTVLELGRIETMGHWGRDGCAAGRVVPRLLNAEKLLRMGGEIRLNVGCGSKPAPEYLNVDERELDGVDLIADVLALPFKPESVAEIYAAHVIEHFTELELKMNLLPAWHRLLRHAGTLRIAVPDAEGMIEAFQGGNLAFENLRTVTYGGQDYPGNFHHTMFSRESLRAILREAGFTVGEYAEVARPNGLCLEMEIRATKA